MTVKDLKSTIRDVVDFPSKGIVFRDLTTLIKDGEALHVMSSALRELYADKGVTKVVGIESRGFIGGSILAYQLGCGFVPARKPGKLPAVTIKKAYAKEYGVDTIELHSDAINENDIVVIHDDLLATGDLYKLRGRAYSARRTQESTCRMRGDFASDILIRPVSSVFV